MDFVSGLVVFILLWWWIFLMSLPFGIKTPDELRAVKALHQRGRCCNAKLLFQLQLHRFSLRLFTGLLIQGLFRSASSNLQY